MKKIYPVLVVACALGNASARAGCVEDYNHYIDAYNVYRAQYGLVLTAMDKNVEKAKTASDAEMAGIMQRAAQLQSLLCTNVSLRLSLVPKILSTAASCNIIVDQRGKIAEANAIREALLKGLKTVCKK